MNKHEPNPRWGGDMGCSGRVNFCHVYLTHGFHNRLDWTKHNALDEWYPGSLLVDMSLKM